MSAIVARTWGRPKPAIFIPTTAYRLDERRSEPD